MKVHHLIPVTRYWTGTKWPIYGSFGAACGRRWNSEYSYTRRRDRVTCRVCKTQMRQTEKR